jgi:protein CpxP
MTTQTKSTNRRWKWLLALPVAGLLAFPALRASADWGGPEAAESGHFGQGRHMAKMLDAAGASDAQRAQIKAVWAGLRPQLQALREQRMKLHEDMRKALTAPTIDAAQVDKLRQQAVHLAEQGSTLFTQGIVQSAQVLTPEQRQKVAAQLDQHPRHHRGD